MRFKTTNKHVNTQHGFTLIELMIAIPLGLLVMFAVLKIFTANIDGVNLQNAYARVQENGRMAMALMTRDIRSADYWGCVNDASSIVNNVKSSDYAMAAIPVGSTVTGENNVVSKSIDDIVLPDGSDTLTLWSAKNLTKVKVSTPYMTTTASDIAISSTSNIADGALLLISDCKKADVFINTKDSNTVLTHSSSADGEQVNISDNLSGTYDGSAQLHAVQVNTYFIGSNTAGSYSLYRQKNNVSSELVRGVSDLQIIYGEDTTGDGSANIFSSADSVTNMDNVTAIRLQLLSEGGSGSSALDRTYTVTTNIRNRTL